MGRREIPSFSSLWQKHEALYVGVFITALKRLSEYGYDTTKEDDISEKLCLFLRCICSEVGRKSNREIRTPDWELPISPVTENELKGGKKRKRPDFTCKLINTFAEGEEDYEISFHVECKLLGARTSRTWELNENYVTKGVQRFDSKSHEYGKRAFSGLMIGYLISMTPEKILEQVNSYQQKHCAGNPAIEYESTHSEIRRYGQKLKRRNVEPRDFRLIHLWVDLRKENETPTRLES